MQVKVYKTKYAKIAYFVLTVDLLTFQKFLKNFENSIFVQSSPPTMSSSDARE